MSVAIAGVLGSALNGSSRERPELAGTAIPLEARLEVARSRGGESFLRSVFEPLGYVVGTERHAVPESQVEYFSIRLQRTCRLQELLEHLYVLIPVLDDQKHYWIAEEEVEKLLRRAGDWLAGHPARDQIVDRYLKHRAPLRREAISRLLDAGDLPNEAAEDQPVEAREEALEKPLSLNEQRLQAVAQALRDNGARRVLDLGCGEGRLIALLLNEPMVDEIVGVEVSAAVIDRAYQRLQVERLPPRQASRLTLLQGSLTYRDNRLRATTALPLLK
jgi:3' terminal RNA ribose 2'-O-methyltransferase Hen1